MHDAQAKAGAPERSVTTVRSEYNGVPTPVSSPQMEHGSSNIGLPLDGTSDDAAHEVALQAEEHDQGQRHAEERSGTKELRPTAN